MRTGLWAELPSPVKVDFRECFHRYAAKAYQETGILLSEYVPAVMGAHMPPEDHLLMMREQELPDCYVTMAYGECSSPSFIRRFLDTGYYRTPEVLCYFPEVLVADMRRLGSRLLPERFEDLADPCYHGELCLIGSQGNPDPMLPLYIRKKLGHEGISRLMHNISALAGPSVTLRTMGTRANRFGSLFLMPALFALLCSEKPEIRVWWPEEGTLAEPILVFFRSNMDPEKERLIRRFFTLEESAAPMQSAHFPMPAHPLPEDIPIHQFCREHLLYPEQFTGSFITNANVIS